MFKSWDNLGLFNFENSEFDIVDGAYFLESSETSINDVSFAAPQFPSLPLNMTVNAPVTPTLWQEVVQLPGPFEAPGPFISQFGILYLNNGNILVYREEDFLGPDNLLGYIIDNFGEIVVPDGVIQSGLDLAPDPDYGLTALGNGGFATIRETDVGNVIKLTTFSEAGVELSTVNLDAGAFSHSSVGEIGVNSAGTLLVTANLVSNGDASTYGWSIESSGVVTGPFLVADDGNILTQSNAENPRSVDVAAVNSSRFAVLVHEMDSFVLSTRRSFDIQVVNSDGTPHVTIELTSVGDGSVSSSDSSMSYLGNSRVGVLYQELTFEGGDGLWHIAFANVETGVVTSTSLLPTGSAAASDIFSAEFTALQDSAGNLTGEYVLSFLNSNSGDVQLHIQRYSSASLAQGAEIVLDTSDMDPDYRIESLDVSRFAVVYDDTNGDNQYAVYSYASEGNIGDTGAFIGTTGDDVLNNTNASTEFYLSDGNDSVRQSAGSMLEIVDLGEGDDIFIASAPSGIITIEGGSGKDLFDLSSVAIESLTVDLNTNGHLFFNVDPAAHYVLSGIEDIYAGGGDNDIRGDDNDNTFVSGIGDDFIAGGAGDDIIQTDGGSNILFGDDGADQITGGFGDDIIVGGRGNDTLLGMGGDDTFYQWNHIPGAFTDDIDGGAGIDTLRLQVYDEAGPQGISGTAYNYSITSTGSGFFTGGSETITFASIEIIHDGDGDSVVAGSNGTDTFFGNGGDDVIFGNGGDDFLDGGDGDDIISGGTGSADTLIGGNGIDTADYTYTNGDLTVSLMDGTAFATASGSGAETLTGFENLILGNGDDIVEGDDNDNVLDAGNGDNIVSGFDGNDTLLGGTGADTLLGGDGDDILSGNVGVDILNGGNGNDTGDYSYSNDDLTIDLENGTAFATVFGSGDEQLISIENVIGGDGDDIIIGNASDNNLDGGVGDDRFFYSAGEDNYDGGDGIDTLDYSAYDLGGIRISVQTGIADRFNTSQPIITQNFSNIESFVGSDTFGDEFRSDGPAGHHFDGRGEDAASDRLTYAAAIDDLTINLIDQLAYNTADGVTSAADKFENIEFFIGGTGDDILSADDGVTALGTRVILSGGDGNDTLIGGDANDSLFGFDDNDTLRGGDGIDQLFGGDGNDRFIYLGANEVGAAGAVVEQVSGGGGVDRIVIDMPDGDEIDFRDADIDSIEELQFDTSVQGGESGAVFDAAQLGGTGLAVNLHVIGSNPQNTGASDVLTFILSSTVSFDLSALTFENWDNSNEVIIRGDGDAEAITGSNQNDEISGFGGNDLLIGNFGDDFLSGGDGVDNLDGGGGEDILSGGAGNDFLFGDFGSDSYDGGEGIDTVLLNHSAEDWTINLLAGTASSASEVETLTSIENIFGSGGNDIIIGDTGDNQLDGQTGNDILTGGLGNDTLIGGFGDDSFIYLSSSENASGEVINGSEGRDSILVDLANGSEIDFSGNVVQSIEVFEFGTTSQSQGGIENGVNINASQIGNNQFSNTLEIIGSNANNIDIFSIFMANVTTLDISGFTFTNWGGVDQELNVIGNNNNETILGSSEADVVSAGGGDDVVTGGEGDDELNGASGTDTVNFSGDRADYTITAIAGGFTISDNVGTDGTDTALNFETFVFADQTLDAANLISGGAGNNVINGTAGNDTLDGTADHDTINGLGGNDILNGLAGDDILNGGAGADRLLGSEGADANNGGDGFDSVDYRGATSRVAFDVITGGTVGDALGDTFSGIERYYLSNFNDTITGSDANEFFFGEDGNDTINAGGGIDRVYGGDGNDIQRGEEGNDQLYGSAGADQLNGGTGFDIANYTEATEAIIVNIATGGTGGDAAGDTYFGLEAIYGSDFDDSITGSSGTNELRGFDGDDVLDGAGGNDRLFGGNGADMLIGGTGIDIAMFTVATAGVTLDLATGGTGGEAAGDSYSGIEWVFGSDFDDDITGDSGVNRLEGRDGNDTLNGEGGNDRLLGGDGNDTINGGDGVDSIFGQAGDDILSGGAGNDFFFGDDGADSHDGGSGTDTVSYLPSSTGVTLNLQTGGTGGDATGDTYTNIERIFGSGHDDSLTGSDGDDVLLGNGGNDFLTGGLGNDSLNGGAGVDSFAYNTDQDAADVIQGFTTNEVIDILFTDPAFDSFAELMAVATNAGANTIFNFGSGNTLTIVGQNISDLSASNFTFTSSTMAEPPTEMDVFAADMVDVFDMDALF